LNREFKLFAEKIYEVVGFWIMWNILQIMNISALQRIYMACKVLIEYTFTVFSKYSVP
jgi:hypothetical protein